jgi:hypothetical protein
MRMKPETRARRLFDKIKSDSSYAFLDVLRRKIESELEARRTIPNYYSNTYQQKGKEQQ